MNQIAPHARLKAPFRWASDFPGNSFAAKLSICASSVYEILRQSTPGMNNNKLNTEALLAHCHGVFAKTSHIDVGTSE